MVINKNKLKLFFQKIKKGNWDNKILSVNCFVDKEKTTLTLSTKFWVFISQEILEKPKEKNVGTFNLKREAPKDLKGGDYILETDKEKNKLIACNLKTSQKYEIGLNNNKPNKRSYDNFHIRINPKLFWEEISERINNKAEKETRKVHPAYLSDILRFFPDNGVPVKLEPSKLCWTLKQQETKTIKNIAVIMGTGKP